MTDYLQTLIDQEFTPSEQKAILVQMAEYKYFLKCDG